MEDAALIIVMFYRLWWIGSGECWVDYCYNGWGMENAGLIIDMFYRLWWMGSGECWVDY